MEIEKAIIIGGGPAGLAAAVYMARAYLNPLVIAGSPPGGQLLNTSDVENYPGFKSILGPDLITNFREHAAHFETKFIDDNVVSVDLSKQPFTVKTSSGSELKSKSILVATGASAQWLNLPNEQRLRGRGVSACAVCDGFFFKEKVVAVIGGGDTAMEEALTLTNFASKVYVLARGSSFRASQIMQDRVLKHPKITVLWDTEVADVFGENVVEGLQIKFNSDKSKSLINDDRLPVQGLFLAIGHKPETDFLINSGVYLDAHGYIKTSIWALWEAKNNPEFKTDNLKFDFQYQYSTTIDGVFAAGDCVDHEYRQAGTAVGMGIAAALEVERWLGEQDNA